LLQWKLSSPYAIAAEMFRWELATAVIGALLEIDPFDEPDVAVAKQKTQAALDHGPTAEEPVLRAQGTSLFATPEHAALLRKAAATLGTPAAASPAGWIAAHLSLGAPGDYIAMQAFLTPDDELEKKLNQIQAALRDATRLACTFGFGPRYLHSTGQLHKGGPNRGLFIQLTATGGEDLPIPGRPYGFQTLLAAQARGDRDALLSRGRRVIRVHLEGDSEEDLLAALRGAARLLSAL
jgi:transaldolase/glucose-6-phosphate isomerase